jgi:acetyltransferase
MLAAVRDTRPGARIVGLLVQRMGPAGALEMLLGAVRDGQFGATVTVGLGGIWVEVVRDTATRLAPLSPAEAQAMLGELRMAPALRGARGRPPVDLPTLAETVCRFAQIAVDLPEIVELEVNPLLVAADATLALDIRGALAGAAEPGGRGDDR